MEVTGSREGTAKSPKFSLLKYYFMHSEIPDMDKLESHVKTGKRVVGTEEWQSSGRQRGAWSYV
jgi:hypothetical protein